MNIHSDPTIASPVSSLSESRSRERHSGFAFVANVDRLIGQDSFELAPSLVLRRATPNEQKVIKALLAGSPLSIIQPLSTGLWELQRLHDGALVPLPEQDRRYFVLAFEGFGDWLFRVQEACDLGPLELEVGFIIHVAPVVERDASPGFSTQFYPARFFHVVQEASFENDTFFLQVAAGQVQTTRRIAEMLAQHDHSVLDLRPLITQIRSLKALQHQSALRFLGYFAVLEALLTHAPKPSDPYESITRQIKRKVALLDNRWSTPLDYTSFGGAPSDKIWAAMYAYRSKLAHGAPADFAKGDLRVLGNSERARQLLIETVKATMRQALEEPRLLIDLREC